ncbi:hypothetical protein V8C35DRAFT_301297 [Trichoderma chlorosporum]
MIQINAAMPSCCSLAPPRLMGTFYPRTTGNCRAGAGTRYAADENADQLLLPDGHFQGSEPLKADNSCKSDHPAPSRPADNQKRTRRAIEISSFRAQRGLCNWWPVTA